MKTVDVELILVSLDWAVGDTGNQFYVGSLVKDEWHPPIHGLHDQQPEESARLLFRTYVDLSPQWAKLRLSHAEKLNGGILSLSYFCTIPFDTRLNSLYWFPVEKVSQEDRLYPHIVEAVRNFS